MAESHVIVTGRAPAGKGRIISVLTGRTYAIAPAGGCSLVADAFGLQDEPEYYEGIVYPGRFRPSIVRRDSDVYVWRDFTDLVFQGTAYADRPVRSREVELRCSGNQVATSFKALVSGDRVVDRGALGPTISEAAPFTEMPLRYDKAFGGACAAAEAKYTNPEVIATLAESFGEDVVAEQANYSYPRNPAGKGFLVAPEGLIGLSLPNLELPDRRIRPADLEGLAAPMDRWGDYPYPACFDWFQHGWFPRVAYFGGIPATHDGLIPEAEVKLGLMRPDEERYPLVERIHKFAQGAHPFLARNRLRGGERVTVTGAAPEGLDFAVTLPTHKPAVLISLLGTKEAPMEVTLDLVFIEGDKRRVTMLWRGTLPAGREHLPAEWQATCPYRIVWT